MDRSGRYIALKDFSLRGTDVSRGDEVDLSGLSDRKIGQFLDRRLVQLCASQSRQQTAHQIAQPF